MYCYLMCIFNMTKYIDPKHLKIVNEFIPDLYAFGSLRIAQIAFLKMLPSKETTKWIYNPDISKIKNSKLHISRLLIEGLFQNHLLDWENVKVRQYNLSEYIQHDCPDLYKAFYRRLLSDDKQSD